MTHRHKLAERKKWSEREAIRELWQEMVETGVERGLLVTTGEMRRNRRGELEPVYRVRDPGENGSPQAPGRAAGFLRASHDQEEDRK